MEVVLAGSLNLRDKLNRAIHRAHNPGMEPHHATKEFVERVLGLLSNDVRAYFGEPKVRVAILRSFLEENTGRREYEYQEKSVDWKKLIRALKKRKDKDERLRRVTEYLQRYRPTENMYRLKDVPRTSTAAALYFLLHVIAEEALKIVYPDRWLIKVHREEQERMWRIFAQPYRAGRGPGQRGESSHQQGLGWPR